MSEDLDKLTTEEQTTEAETPEVASASNEPAILQVKAQDELGALLQRLKSEPATQIRLVIPERAIVAQGPIALKLLADVAAKLQKEVSIVSDQPQVQSLARRAGLKIEGVEAGDTEGHGFVPGADVAAAGIIPMPVQPIEDEGPVIHRYDGGIDDNAVGADKRPGYAAKTSGVMAGGKSAWLEWIGANRTMLGVAAAFLLVIFGGFMMASYYLPKATVTLYTEKRTIDRDLQVTASPNVSAVNKEKLIVPATVLTAEVEQAKTFPATGEDEVGEKATGKVTIFNKTENDITVKAGTVIETDGKQFIVSNAVEVPSASVKTTFDPITFKTTKESTPGKKDVGVVAAVIGPEYNLKQGTDFTVGNFDRSSVSARNAEALSGGTKEKVTVITKEDQQSALESLSKDAQSKAKADLRKKLSQGQLLLDEAITLDTQSTSFSHKVGDEVDEFSLTIKVAANAPVVDGKDLESLLTGAIEEKVPDGYKLDSSKPEIENHVMEVSDDGVLQLTSTFKAQVVPVVDEKALVDEIKGKNPSAVEAFLKGQPNLNGYDISLSPKLPGPFYRLPKLESNIKVNVEVKD